MVALSLAPADACAQARAVEGESRRVVILNAADPYLPAFVALDSALRSAIRTAHPGPVELHAETLDMHQFPRARFDREVVALLHKKYKDLSVDVVVATAPIALDIAQRHRAEIWPGAAIVFYSVPAGVLNGRALGPRTTGVPVRLGFGATIDLALKLRPATRRIAVVAGTGEPDRRNLALARASLERYAQTLEVQYLVDLTLADTIAAVEALPPDAAVLYLTVYRDAAGTPLVPREALAQIAAASPAPVFGAFETYLGNGIVAGSITSYAVQGRRAGELVARVLNGDDPSALGVQAPDAPGCIADWRQLRRWRIDERLLPEGCDIRFRELTAWDRYREFILAALAVIVAQAVLIVALMLNRWRLRKAQTALRDEYGRRVGAESIAARLRLRLVRFSRERTLGAMAAAIAHEVNQPLLAIQNYAQAARRRLQGHFDDRPKLMELVAKIEGQAERAGAITQRVRSLVSTSSVQLEPVALPPLLEEFVRIMEPECESRGCRITCTPAAGLPAVLADGLQVQLVLVNLARNAMQSVCAADHYDKRVSIDASRINDREVQVSVADRGGGVPPERVAEIFEPLYSGTDGGMGMGLAICRDIMEVHGGRIWYEPNPAGGAIFRFTLRTVGP